MRVLAALSASALLLGAGIATGSPASAHTPSISGDCDGIRLVGTAYDATKANEWSVTIGGVTQSGTFGSTLDRTFPVPQDGATTAWSASIQAPGGQYRGERSGTAGPCGTPPPVDVCEELPGDQPEGTVCTPPPAVERSEEKSLEGCVVTLGGKDYGAGSLTYDEVFTDTYVFDAGTNTWKLVVDTTATVADVAFTPWSVQEQVAAGCVETPGPPPAAKSSESTAEIDCAAGVIVTTTTATTTDYVYDEQTNTWVLGEPVSTTTTDESPVQPGDCDEPGGDQGANKDDNKGVLGTQSSSQSAEAAPVPAPAQASAVQPVAVPTSVTAGVAPAASAVAPAGPAGPGAGVLALLTLGGLLLGAGALRAYRA